MAGERARAARPSSAKMWEESERDRDGNRDGEPRDSRRDRANTPNDRKGREHTPADRYAGRKRSRSPERADLRGDTKRSRPRSPGRKDYRSRDDEKDDRRSRRDGRDARDDRDRTKREEGATNGSSREDRHDRGGRRGDDRRHRDERVRDEKIEKPVNAGHKGYGGSDSREPPKGPRGGGGFRKPDFKLSASAKPTERPKGNIEDEDEDAMEDVRTEENPVTMDDSSSLMMDVMGFAEFKTTKNTKVPGNHKNWGVRRDTHMQARQYMNRPGGFNRPLSPGR